MPPGVAVRRGSRAGRPAERLRAGCGRGGEEEERAAGTQPRPGELMEKDVREIDGI